MAWFKVFATIEMEIEARNEDDAISKAQTIIEKRVIGQSFGSSRNDRGEVTQEYTIDEVKNDDEEE